MLLVALLFGLLATLAFLFPAVFNAFLPFYQLRPFHVSAALFWILTGAVGSISYFKSQLAGNTTKQPPELGFVTLWVVTIGGIFCCYALRIFGGREYWEFPPVLCLPLLAAWILWMWAYYRQMLPIPRHAPVYQWMWATGIFFFFLTFLEQNLWQLDWFRSSFLKEVTVQWKANGAMVGAWNQMIYGTAMYMMVQLTGDKTIGTSKQAFFFYFLGLTNLMFNWGHHIYNLPASSWIRNVSYIISMTEWIIFIQIIRGFRAKMNETKILAHRLPYLFLLASEFWVFVNLLLALLMSIPALNRYTHGTHVTVAHAMGTTIGINTMILLGSMTYILKPDENNSTAAKRIKFGLWLTNISLLVFFVLLVSAGVIKGYRSVALGIENFQVVMDPVWDVIKLFFIAGLGLSLGLGSIAYTLLKRSLRY